MLLMMAFLVPMSVMGQETVTIGTGTTANNQNPFGTYYNYSFTEQLYTAAEIGMAGTISSISFNYAFNTAKNYPLDVYMKTVTNENLSSAIPIANSDLVFNGTLSVTGAGWVTINLDTPFEYDGTGNLLIAINKGYVYYFSGDTWYYTSSSNMARYVQNDSSPYTPTSSLPSTQASSNRPNIKIVITPISNPKPINLTVSNLESRSATLSWTAPNENVIEYQYQYKAGEGEWTVPESTTATSVALTGLTSDTEYTFQVKAIYAEEESNYASTSFHTEISCPVPTDFQVASLPLGATTVTLSWEESGSANAWVLQYGTDANFTSGSYTEVDDGFTTLGTTISKVLTDLTLETKYYARVKADCGDDDQSVWSNTLEFMPSVSINIGDGTELVNFLPVFTYQNYSITQQIYTANEIAAAGGNASTITAISFHYHGYTQDNTMEGIQVYMAHTTKSFFSYYNDVQVVSDDDKVYEGPLYLPAEGGWITIILDKEFEYDGTNNILVCVYDPTNGYPATNSTCSFYVTSTAPTYMTNTFGDPNYLDINLLTSYSGSRNYFRSNIRFLPTSCPKPKNLAVSNITAYSANLSWTAPDENLTYQYQYKIGAGEWTDWESTTNTSVDITLVPESEYTFRVKALYADGESGLASIGFTALATCPKPTDLNYSLTLGNGTVATLTWLQGYEEDAWVLQYGTDHEFAESTYTEVTTGFTVDGGTITANLTGLQPETQLYARVKADCGEGDQSYWSNVVEFKPTFAIPLTVCDGTWTDKSIPMYGEKFSYQTKSECIMPYNLLTDMDDCQITSLTFYPYSVNSGSWGSAYQQVFLKEVDLPILENNYSGLYDATIVFEGSLPDPILSDEGYTITFSQPYTYHGGYLLIGVYNLSTGNSNSVYWYGVQSASLENVSGYGASASFSMMSQFLPDNFLPKTTFSYIPNPTARPRHLAASNIAIHSATLSWTAANEDVTGYQYRYMPEGGEWTGWTGTTSLSVDLEGLTAETEYTFQVKALYGEVESNVASISFTPTRNMSLSLYVGATNATSNIPINGSYYNNYAKNESLFPATQLAAMDGATISAITFYAKEVYNGTLNGTTQVFIKEVDHTILDGYEGTEDATIVYEGQLPEPTTSLDGYTIHFTQEYTYHGGNLLIGIYNITPGSSSKQVNWYGVYTSQYASANGYNSTSLESVGCSKSKWLPKTTFTYFFRNPWNLQASNYTLDGATLSWNEPRVDYLRCEYQYQAEGSEEWSELVSTNGTSVALSGLTSETNYIFRVRAVYEGEEAGDFVSVTFQIPVFIDAAHPFADGFEEGNHWMLFNGTETNQWTIDTATHLQGEKSLYITNDGQSYAYSSTMSHVFATKTFHLLPGTYEIGYTWKTKGCNQDIVNLVVAPESATFAAGVSAIDYIQSAECLVYDYYYSSSNYPSWYQKTKQFEVVEEGLYKVVFYWYNLNGYAYNPPAAIDNFYLNMYLGAAPSNLTTSNITAHTGDLSWVENGTAESWQVKYFTNEEYSSSGYNVNNENYGHVVDAETNTDFTLSGLDPETEYIWFVRSSYTMDDQTGYTHWSSSHYFETTVSCLPVIDLHVAELGTTSATLAWDTDPQQEQDNMPTEWNVRYITAPATLYDFESENTTPQYSVYSDNSETPWSIVEDADNAHSISHYMQSPDCYGYIEFPAYGGGAASFWAKSLVEDENDTVYISIYYDGNSSSGSGGDYKGRGNDKDRNSYMGGYIVTSDTYKKITVDLADYRGEGTLRLQLEGQIALDDITVNMSATTVTQQTLDFNQGSIGDYAYDWEGWLLYETNGYILSEENHDEAYVDFPVQLGNQISFRAKALVDENDTIKYYLYVWKEGVGLIAQDSIMVTDTFEDYTWDLSQYSGTAYLEFYAEYQPSLVIDDLTIPMVSTYTDLIVEGEPTLQMTDLQQLAVYTVGVQAHCGEGDESTWETLSFVPALCESEDQCQISYEWNTVDDAWNDAYLKVIHHESGLRVAQCQMEVGTSGMGYFSLCDGEVYDLYYDAGGKGYVDFTVYDPAGEVIASYAMFQSLTEDDDPYITFTMDCSVCQWPQNLMASNLTTQSATLTWEQGGDVTSWLVSYKDLNAMGDVILNQSDWTAVPQGWLPLTFDEDDDLVETEDWTPGNGALVSDTMSFLFIPVSLGGQAVVTARGSENEALLVGVYQGGSPVGMNMDNLPEESVEQHYLSEDPQQYFVDLSGYQGDGYLFLYHGCGSEPANLYLDQLVVYGQPEWSEGVIVNSTPTYTISGLTPGTPYQARVQAVCGVGEYGNPARVSFVTPFCNPENQCTISYVLRDSYGDSWENAYVSVVHHNSDTEVARLTMKSNDGYELAGTLALCDGETYDFMYVYGNCCANEHRFAIYDPSGEVVMDYLNGTPNQTDVVSYTMDCSGTPTTVQLSEGWNWWTPISEVSVDVLATAIGDYVVSVVTEDGEPVSAFVPGEMYRILVNADCELTLMGASATSAEIEIGHGPNWFGFIGTEMSVTEAFADFEPEVGDKVVSQDQGFAIYDGEHWVGTLTTLVLGKGYVYVSQASETKTLYLGQ